MPTLEQETAHRLATIAELYDISDTHLTGRGISEYEGGPIVGRFGGFKKSFHELRRVDDSPKAIAAAIRKGSGKVFDRVYTAVKASVEAEGFKPARRRSPGRPTEPPHEGRPYCVHCREFHTKGQHRSHGAGSFHRTHLFSFGGNPMKLATARRVFAELMKRSRAGKLTDKERAALRRASQIIRYATRKTAAANPRRKRAARGNPYIKTGKQYLRVVQTKPDEWAGGNRLKVHAGGHWWYYEPVIRKYKMERYPGEKQRRVGVLVDKKPGENPKRGGVDAKLFREYLRERGFMVDTSTSKEVLAQLYKLHGKDFEKWRGGRSLFDSPGALFKGNKSRRRAAAKNPRNTGGLIRMGRLVEIRYERDHGRAPGLYKHPFTHRRPTIYYRKSDDTIIIR